MPPSYVNIGAWVGDGDDGRFARARRVVRPDRRPRPPGGRRDDRRRARAAGARPVIVEDDAFVGAGSALLDGVLVGRGAVIGAGVTLTGTSRLYDLVRDAVLIGTPDAPLAVPPGVVVVPGGRAVAGGFAEQHGLSIAVTFLVKDRDPGTSARVALETALR